MLLIFVLTFAACTDDPRPIKSDLISVYLGEFMMQIAVHEAEEAGRTFIVLHEDENTASEVALGYISEHGGRLVELRHGGSRNVTFGQNGGVYTFDPNRVFTPEGAEATLRNLSTFSDAALAEVTNFAEAFLTVARVDSMNVIITAHNNTDENYSALSYTEGGRYHSDALFTFIGKPAEPDNFFFVTSRELYDELREGGFNVVLQDNAAVSNDGSLSVYAAKQGIPYVNVETQHGHFGEQMQMLAFLMEVLEESGR